MMINLDMESKNEILGFVEILKSNLNRLALCELWKIFQYHSAPSQISVNSKSLFVYLEKHW